MGTKPVAQRFVNSFFMSSKIYNLYRFFNTKMMFAQDINSTDYGKCSKATYAKVIWLITYNIRIATYGLALW